MSVSPVSRAETRPDASTLATDGREMDQIPAWAVTSETELSTWIATACT